MEDLLAETSEMPIERLDWSPELLRYSDEAITEELERRGLA